MSMGVRAEKLAVEFVRFGLDEPEAVQLSSEFVTQHPLAHRVGVARLRTRFTDQGLAPDDAQQLALALWGLERLWLGACYKDLVDTLRRADVDDADAIPACMEARRMFSAADQSVDPDQRDSQLLRWCAVFAVTVALATLAAHLGV